MRHGSWHVVGQARQSVVCAHAPPMVSTTAPLQGDIKPTLCDQQLPHWVPACFTESQSAQNTQNPAESLHESLDLSKSL